MKLRLQAQNLQPGDIVGSGEVVSGIIVNSVKFPASKVLVSLIKDGVCRNVQWGKYTMINLERPEKVTA